jgi:hypothetical protein
VVVALMAQVWLPPTLTCSASANAIATGVLRAVVVSSPIWP